MGFRARSSEEALTWVLRRTGVNSLRDGYSLSFILVNDRSPVVEQFIREHFVDLCERTADRIRFVFFADVDQESAEFAVHSSWRGDSSPLRSLFRRWLPGGQSDPRPKGPAELQPALGGLSRLLEHAAYDGPGVAIRFAQALGIGAEVPCIILHPDLGSAELRILPFAGRSAADIYRLLRGWIDEYYRVNRERFATMRDAQDKVDRARSLLGAASALAASDDRIWSDIGTLGRVLGEIERGSANYPAKLPVAAVDAVLHDNWRFLACAHHDLTLSLHDRRNIAALVRDLRSDSPLPTVRMTLSRIGDAVRTFPASSAPIDAIAVSELASYRERLRRIELELRRVDSEEALTFWLRQLKAHPASRKVLVRSSLPWPGRWTVGAAEALATALAAVTLDMDTSRATDAILGSLAGARGVAPDDEVFCASSCTYRDSVAAWLDTVLPSCPSFLRRSNVFQLSTFAGGSLSTDEERRALAAARRNAADLDESQRVGAERSDLVLGIQDTWDRLDFVRRLDQHREALRVSLRETAMKARNQLLAALGAPATEDDQGRSVRASFVRAADALAEVRHQASTLHLPFLRHPAVRTMRVGGRWFAASADASQASVEQLSDDLARDFKALEARPKVSAASRLADALLASDPEGCEHLVDSAFRGPLRLRLIESMGDDGAASLLGGLPPQMLRQVLLRLDAAGKDVSDPALVRAVLAGAGFPSDHGLFGLQAYANVVAACRAAVDSADDEVVFASGGRLRRRSERLLKQFVRAYHRLAGEPMPEHRQTVRPLADVVLRIVNRAGDLPESAECMSLHERLMALAAKRPQLMACLDRLCEVSNAFSHDQRVIDPTQFRRMHADQIDAAQELVELFEISAAYPVCLRFMSLRTDPAHGATFEFGCDPPLGGRETLVFSTWPPVLGDDIRDPIGFLMSSTLLMIPRNNPTRVDPWLIAY